MYDCLKINVKILQMTIWMWHNYRICVFI